MTLLYAEEIDFREYAYRRKFWYKNSKIPIAARGLCAKGVVTLVFTDFFCWRTHSILAHREHILC